MMKQGCPEYVKNAFTEENYHNGASVNITTAIAETTVFVHFFSWKINPEDANPLMVNVKGLNPEPEQRA